MSDLEEALERIVRRVVREEVRAALREVQLAGGGDLVALSKLPPGVEQAPVRAAVKRNELRTVKLGRQLLVRRDELAAWIESRRAALADAGGDELDQAMAQGRLRAVRGGRT
jgi:excisionase family DNA binding protein